MTYNQSSYIRVRYGVYHFVRRVPADVKQHYRSDRVSISLRTKSSKAAIRSAQSISQRLDDYWHGLRLQKMDVPALHLIIDDNDDADDNSPTMMEAVDIYLRLKATMTVRLLFVLLGAMDDMYQKHWGIDPSPHTHHLTLLPFVITCLIKDLLLEVSNASLGQSGLSSTL